MVDDLQRFRQSALGIDYQINPNMIIHHPTLEEICNFGEQRYYSMVTALCAGPSTYKVALFDRGIDWETITDFEFFCLMCQNLNTSDTSILLGSLDLSQLKPAHNPATNETVLARENHGKLETLIDRALHMELAEYIRQMHGFEQKVDKPADAHTKQYMIDRERRRLLRHQKDASKSMLMPLISGMVNLAGFKYDYSTIWNLPISAFNDSVCRVQKYLRYTQLMQASYAGQIDMKALNLEELNWLN